MTPSEVLKKYWGYDSFRPLQSDIIDSVLDGRDTLALLPTGGGKSICYQVPALVLDGLTIVVSPLIALMKDQVQNLNDRHIKAACLTSGMTQQEQEIVLQNSIHGGLKLLYVSPERLQQRVFIEHLRRMKVSLFTIDEAHCISQWGNDFRPTYLEVVNVRQYHPEAPCLALTATATHTVVDDIKRTLSFRADHRQFVASFRRANLAYIVQEEQDKIGRLLRLISNVPGTGIVYVRSRRRAYEVAMTLRGHGVATEYYHAGRTQRERDLCQQLWSEGRVRVIVATNAFGMGIDKSDVRFVAHLDPPDSPEAYFQEAGRAGRDGKRAYCALFYTPQDIEQLHQSLDEKFPPIAFIRNIYNGLCNFYRLPMGGGEGSLFELDVNKICNTYNLRASQLYNAMQHLERNGVISLPPEDSMRSRLHIPISRDEIYRYQLRHPQQDFVLQTIFKLYGGLFSDFMPINEAEIARRCYLKEDDIVKTLKHLDIINIVDYLPRVKGTAICFSSPRVAPESLFLNEKSYRQLRQAAEQRLKAMTEYIGAREGCRSQLLLSYFGETDSTPCNCCDLCIEHRKASQHNGQKTLTDAIAALLTESPMTSQQIITRLQQQAFPLDQIESVLTDMTDRHQIGIDKEMRFYLRT
ncbi:MAG: RecQ family ATP-dependent DNA helicase [Bacteroidales bacterium]|nr:RecQ family ATP-dependent DNA helicase [Bacteroidales bacterium]